LRRRETMMIHTEHIQWEEARGALYGFFSQAFIRGPSPQFLKALVSDAGTMNLSEIFPDAAYRQELAQVRLDAREGRLTLETAALDFEALFRVPGSRYLSPYESVYRSEGAGGRGCLCGPEAVAVERLYLQEGLGPEGEFCELPDHVGVPGDELPPAGRAGLLDADADVVGRADDPAFRDGRRFLAGGRAGLPGGLPAARLRPGPDEAPEASSQAHRRTAGVLVSMARSVPRLGSGLSP